MKYPYISGIEYESTVDGPGIRAVFFLSGCNHNCINCHNPQTHNPEYGEPITDEMIEQIADQLTKKKYIDGITLSGGDPLFNPDKTLNFIEALSDALIRRNNGSYMRSLWIYSGDTWERLMAQFLTNRGIHELLIRTHVLVDGPFVEKLADKTLSFRGSSNQRLIDVAQSLIRKDICLWKNTSSEV